MKEEYGMIYLETSDILQMTIHKFGNQSFWLYKIPFIRIMFKRHK